MGDLPEQDRRLPSAAITLKWEQLSQSTCGALEWGGNSWSFTTVWPLKAQSASPSSLTPCLLITANPLIRRDFNDHIQAWQMGI